MKPALRSPLSAIQAALVVPSVCLAFLSSPLRLAAACSYSLSPTLTNVPPTASTGSFRVTTTGGCAWTALANSGWILVTSASNGTGTATITFAVAATTNIALRAGTITVAGNTFTIRQSGDTNHPTNSITSPAPGQPWSNAVFTAQGTASDNVQVANVRWRLNGGGWSDATTSNNWTNWAADLSLVPGTNTLGAYAIDSARNASVTNSVSFIYVNAQTPIIGVNGDLNFGAVITNTTATRTLTITNSGNSTLNVTGISYPAGFSGAWSGSVAASGSTNVTVTFAPNALASYGGTVSVTSDASSGVNTISASGSGIFGFVATWIIGVNGDLNFGAVITNTTATRSLTITNSGNSTLNVTGISYPAGFSGAWGGSVAAGGSTNVTVTFAPTAVTSYGGTVTVTSDAVGGVNTISASGSGTTNQAQPNYQRILSFGPLPLSGSSPIGQLVEARDGWLYGTTSTGGADGSGTVFKISRTGSGFASLHNFSDADGAFPFAGVIETNGVVYGTTRSGGSNGGGAVFKLNMDGSGFSLLHAFPASIGDGAQPTANLIVGKGGILYGTTSSGGAATLGTVFSLNLDGSGYTIRHNFAGTVGGDGSLPFSSLCQGTDGTAYGTTQAGGSNNQGTVFRLNPDGTGYATLHHFSGAPADGRQPLGGLVQGSDGTLYGTTHYGGANDLGTVFKLGTNGGAYAVLRDFTSGSTGNEPLAGLAQGVGSVLYGTTRYGGSNDGGTAFKLSTDGSGYAVLHSFSGIGGDGSQPFDALLLGTDGALYGSTYSGGDFTTNTVYGTLFRLFGAPAQVLITSITPASGGFSISFAGGAAGHAYQIQATTNLSGDPWQVIGSSTAAINGTFSFLDSAASNTPSRFYRSWGN